MKSSLIILTILTSSNLFCQEFSKKIKEEFSVKFCDCLNKSEQITQVNISDCSQVKLTNYEEELSKIYNENSSESEYEQGYKAGSLLMSQMQEIFINNCDTYYYFWENLKEKTILENKENYKDFNLTDLNNKINHHISADLLWERGIYYFHINELENAKLDFEKALTINPKHYQSYFFIAWIYEKKNEYKKAVDLLEMLVRETSNNDLQIPLLIAKRKLKEFTKN